MDVSDRKAETLLAAILQHIEANSTILSDCWKCYQTNELENAGFAHSTVNHT